jgi:hypothetical protein
MRKWLRGRHLPRASRAMSRVFFSLSVSFLVPKLTQLGLRVTISQGSLWLLLPALDPAHWRDPGRRDFGHKESNNHETKCPARMWATISRNPTQDRNIYAGHFLCSPKERGGPAKRRRDPHSDSRVICDFVLITLVGMGKEKASRSRGRILHQLRIQPHQR